MGIGRRYILQVGGVRPSGATVTGVATEFNLLDAFSGEIADGTEVQYDAITTEQLGSLSENEYRTRVEDFLTIVEIQEDGAFQTLLDRSEFNSTQCDGTPVTTAAPTTTTTAAPTTTTTTTASPSVTCFNENNVSVERELLSSLDVYIRPDSSIDFNISEITIDVIAIPSKGTEVYQVNVQPFNIGNFWVALVGNSGLPDDIYDVSINLTNVECDTETYNIRVEVDNSTGPAPAIPV